MKTIYVQFTAGVGPTECAVACENVVKEFCNMYIDMYYFKVISVEEDDAAGYRSAIIEIPKLKDTTIEAIKGAWEGTVKFVSTKNSIRPHHKRKNWFIGVNIFEEIDYINLDANDLKWETMKASGPGGQHVNRTESAVRVTHIPTGISVHCDASRNQKQNKDTALKLLMAKINVLNHTKLEEHKNLIWLNHKSVERGNEIMTIKGELLSNMFKESFINYLKASGLKNTTIVRYSEQVPSKEDVQNIAYQITGISNLFDIVDVNLLDIIYNKIKDSEFDKTGHRMYSCGINRYIGFVSKSKDLILKQEIIKLLNNG